MVVRIKTGKSLRRALSYNERKLTNGQALLLLASGFPVDEGLLGFSAKFNRFRSLLERRPKTETNALHITLNFPPEEALSDEKLQKIAMEYMEGLGFAGQPFLVYRHMDTHHPHIHIVTTNVREKGRPIYLHNIAKRLSEPARKAIEANFGLIPADSRIPKEAMVYADLPLSSMLYGKEETKHRITNIVGFVCSAYKFASFEEFNAVLGQFGITAFQGSKGSRMEKNGGLMYSFVDSSGMRRGIPIKASSIFGEPTLKKLQKTFASGMLKKVAFRDGMVKTLNFCLSNRSGSRPLLDKLKAKDIGLVAHRDETGNVDSVYFVDHRRKLTLSAGDAGISLDMLKSQLAEVPAMTKSTEKRQDQSASHGHVSQGDQLAIPASTLAILGQLLNIQSDSSNSSQDVGRKKRRKKRTGL